MKPNIMNQSKQKVIVMTGVTSGLGAHALRQLASRPDTRIIIGARGVGRAVPRGVQVIPLDLSSLENVREFAGEVKRQLGDASIDSLVLNAGIQTSKNDKRSAEGYELTFAVNHLSHYLLARLLLPSLGEHSRLLITTSETHDPANTPIAPKSLDIELLAHPTASGFGSGIKAYAASKLCNLMTAHYIAKLREVKERRVEVIAFSPGLTGGTSLGRDSSIWMRGLMRFLIHTVFRVVGLFKPEYVLGKPERAGEALAEFTLGELSPPEDRIYVSLVKGQAKYPDPSALAENQEKQKNLWEKSAQMVGKYTE